MARLVAAANNLEVHWGDGLITIIRWRDVQMAFYFPGRGTVALVVDDLRTDYTAPVEVFASLVKRMAPSLASPMENFVGAPRRLFDGETIEVILTANADSIAAGVLLYLRTDGQAMYVRDPFALCEQDVLLLRSRGEKYTAGIVLTGSLAKTVFEMFFAGDASGEDASGGDAGGGDAPGGDSE